MKLSLQSLSRKAGETFLRFPLSIAAAIAGTIVMVMVSHQINKYPDAEPFLLYRLAMSCYLVMLLSISVSLYAERFTFSAVKKNILFAGNIVLGVLYFLSLPEKVDVITSMRFVLFIIGLHQLVAFAPFMVRNEMNGLWQFNKYLFIRILTSALYSAVLFIGLALALFAIEKLFNVRIEGKYYFDLLIVIGGIFNTWFFLSGIPENLPALEEETSYPKGLKIFTVYVLLPLVCIYLVILYVYAGKIVVTAQWPVGWVAYLVIAFSIFGILSFLLIFPLREDEAQLPADAAGIVQWQAGRWVRTYSHLFYLLLAPLIVLLFVAIFKRVNMYGVTEERYFVIVLACWLAFISLYLVLTGGNKFKIIPVSLCIIAFLSSFGPWGAFNVSRNSQVKELTTLLDSNHVLKNGVVDTTATHDVTPEVHSRIEDIVRYLNNVHGYKSMQPFFTQNLDSVLSKDDKGLLSRVYYYGDEMVSMMKLKIIYSLSDTAAQSSRYYKGREREMATARGYDFVVEFNLKGYDEVNVDANGAATSHTPPSDTTKFVLKNDTLYLTYKHSERKIYLSYKNIEPLILDAGSVFDAIYASGSSAKLLPDSTYISDFPIENESKEWKAKVVFSELTLDKQSRHITMHYASGTLFVSLNTGNVDRENEVGEKKE